MAADLILLERSSLSRATGLRHAGEMILELAKMEQPFMGACFTKDNGYEYWPVEKQWWLKHKRLFQDLGFLPANSYNKDKKILQMLEKY
jgi:hypothetical protein